jgi:hypothetical protein
VIKKQSIDIIKVKQRNKNEMDPFEMQYDEDLKIAESSILSEGSFFGCINYII